MASGSDVRGAKTRGWVAVVAGVFVVVLMSGVWVVIVRALAENRATFGPGTATFLGQTYTGFAMIIVCGVLGIANGIVQLRTGRRSRILSVGTIVLFAAAIIVVALATRTAS